MEIDQHAPSFRSFMQATGLSRAQVTYFYGFPCYPGDSCIRPLFIFDVELEQRSAGAAFALQPNQPRLNRSWTGSRATAEEKRHAANALRESWDDAKTLSVNLNATLQRLEQVLPNFDRDALTRNPSGVLFRAIDSTYTRGLEQELEQLTAHPTSNAVCDLVLNRDGEPIDESYRDIMEITPLNDEQRTAIKSASVNTFTVVTGPPGTGKSQIVLNVIANALLNDDTVLFASKNHQAVDVVIERLSRIQSEPLILKYGNQEEAFAEALLDALERATDQDGGALDSEISGYEAELARIQREEREARQVLNRIVSRRNRVVQLESFIEPLISKLPSHISVTLELYDPPVFSASFKGHLDSLERLAEEAERPTIITRILSLLGKSLDKRFIRATRLLLAAMPESCESLLSGSRSECLEVLAAARTLSQWIEHQGELSSNVAQNWIEPRIEVLRARIADAQERAIDVTLRE